MTLSLLNSLETPPNMTVVGFFCLEVVVPRNIFALGIPILLTQVCCMWAGWR